jgi:hypothetical protein
MENEDEFVDAAKKAVAGDRPGAIEAAASAIAGLLTGHPLVGVAVGKGAGMLAEALVDRATQRMLDAEREWDDERAKVEDFKRHAAEALEPLFREQADQSREQFLQTLRLLSVRSASAEGQAEILRRLNDLIDMHVDASARDAASTAVREPFTRLHAKIAAYTRAACDVRDAFDLAGESAVDPDPETDKDLTRILDEYNEAYKDLRDRRVAYVEPVTRCLDKRPELAARVRELVAAALDDVHQGGVLAFNDVYKKFVDVRRLRAQAADQPDRARAMLDEIARIRAEGVILVAERVQRVSRQLFVLERKLDALADDLLCRR